MRTTLTLDPDVVAALKKEIGKGDRTFKEIVNQAIRRGLGSAPSPRQRFVQRTWPGGGGKPLMSEAEIKELLLDEDIERYREASRR